MASPSRLQLALAALAPSGGAFDAGAAAERLRRAEPETGAAPGWSADEWREHLGEPWPAVELADASTGGVVLCVPHASELVLAPLARAGAHLARGERVLLVVPGNLPALAHLAAAWAGAECRALAVVVDDGLGCLREALGARAIGRVEASGPPARVQALAELCASACAAEVERELRVLRNTSLVVGREDDPEAAAREAVQRAFGRVRALGGQREGALGRVVCHERSFSRFTSALLAQLEGAGEVALALLEPETREHLEAAWALGLDEGATPLVSHEDHTRMVFTNVDPRLQLAALARCAPLLCLVRASGDAEARETARRLDDDARSEDLAGRR